jgi:hypothetical protein
MDRRALVSVTELADGQRPDSLHRRLRGIVSRRRSGSRRACRRELESPSELAKRIIAAVEAAPRDVLVRPDENRAALARLALSRPGAVWICAVTVGADRNDPKRDPKLI